MQPDVLMLDRIGGAYTHASLLAGGLGGSELELLQVAYGLTAKGHSVVVANGVDHISIEDGVTYVPHAQAWQHAPRKALYLQRWSTSETRLEIAETTRVIVRANDVYCPPYDVHRGLLESGRAGLVANTQWQAGLFGFAKEKTIIPPMLEPMPKVKKQRGLFVFASGAMKGFEATAKLWCEMKLKHQVMADAQLAIVSPGWGLPRPLTDNEMYWGIRFIGDVTPKHYRRWIAKAEGLFMVSTMPETFGCAAALAERAHTRTHILCQGGFGGIPEAVDNEMYYISDDPVKFEERFLEPWGLKGVHGWSGDWAPPDLTPAHLIDRWADVLHVDQPAPIIVAPVDPLKILPRADRRPTVGLCLIAKGEEAATVATRAIVSAKRAGVDCCTVVCDADDTTASMARELGADVFIRPSPKIDWEQGYGVIAGARNDALVIAETRTDYVLVLDADDYFEGTLPSRFDRDAYEVTITDGGLSYQRVQLFRSTMRWRYHGIIHETLQMTGAAGPCGRLEGLSYRRGRSSYGYQDQDPALVKYAKHAHLARKWLLDHPDDARMQFYLARSLQDGGQLPEAMIEYEKRLAMLNGWDEERSYSAYQMGLIQIQQGKDPSAALLQAYGIGVSKAEPLVTLARWYRDATRRQFSTARMFAQRATEIPEPLSALFTQPMIYQYEAAAELAIAEYWLGRKQDALRAFEALCVPPEQQAWKDQQIAICRQDLAGADPRWRFDR